MKQKPALPRNADGVLEMKFYNLIIQMGLLVIGDLIN